jgi:hypothetical protein
MRQLPRSCRGPASIAAALAFTALLATACSGPAAHTRATNEPNTAVLRTTAAPSAASSAASTARPSEAATAPASPPAEPAPVASAPTGVPQCPTSALRVSMGQANGAAGSIYYPLVLTNASTAACTMFGYPGVSFVTGTSGRQIGGAAVRNPTFAAQLVTLSPGASAHAALQVVVAQNYPTSICDPVTAHLLRIYPPGQFAPLYLSFTALTCTGKIEGGSTLGVFVVRPGAAGQ